MATVYWWICTVHMCLSCAISLCVFLCLPRSTATFKMWVNSNSSFGDNLSYHCYNSRIMIFISVGLMAVKVILVFPLCLFILYSGYQQRSLKTGSHCDVFTYHLSLIELFWAPGCIFYLCGRHSNNLAMILLGMCAFSFTYLGQILFQVLTCVERYLAVIHPVIYMTSRNARGLRIRKITIGSVWLLSSGLITLNVDPTTTYITIAVLCVMFFAITVITFCSISVLYTLMHPAPGEGGGEKARVAQSKQRAFKTITAILGVLLLWCVCVFLSNALSYSFPLSPHVLCPLLASINWLNLPTNLTAPLLYLNRSGKLTGCWFNVLLSKRLETTKR